MSQTGPMASSSHVRPGRAWFHFAVAAGLLLAAGAGWNGIMGGLQWTMSKRPVPWPAGVAVEAWRLTSMPEALGPYVLVEDGELTRDPDGQPDGVLVFHDEDLKTLGTTAHALNWYASLMYRDSRGGGPKSNTERQYVRVDITYYTGLLDAVPHVPDNCLGAAGAAIVLADSGPMDVSVPLAASPWDAFPVYRTTYVMRDKATKTAQYFFFSMNGKPTTRWQTVRGQLTLPWVKYCYFAKVQLAVFRLERGRLLPERDLAGCDGICRDFLKFALPEILRFLPSAEDVKRLDASGVS